MVALCQADGFFRRPAESTRTRSRRGASCHNVVRRSASHSWIAMLLFSTVAFPRAVSHRAVLRWRSGAHVSNPGAASLRNVGRPQGLGVLERFAVAIDWDRGSWIFHSLTGESPLPKLNLATSRALMGKDVMVRTWQIEAPSSREGG